MNQRQKVTSLKYLLNEVTGKHGLSRNNKQVIRYTTLNENDIKQLLSSSIFTVSESATLGMFLDKTKTKFLTESRINKLEKSVKIIKESNDGDSILTEGFFGDIWDGLKKMGNKAKEALVGGWGKLKAIWGEFKELVTELVNNISEMFNGVLDWGKNQAVAFYQKQKQKAIDMMTNNFNTLDDVNKKKQLGTDLKNAYDTGKWAVDNVKQVFASKDAEWYKGTIEGQGNPTEPAEDLTPEEVESELKAPPPNENISANKNIIHERNQLFSDANVVRALYNSSKRRLSEGGGGTAHLEDALKDGVLKRVIGWATKVLQVMLVPVAKAAQIVTELAANNAFETLSKGVKFFGGPGAFVFPVFALIIAEIAELLVKEATASWTNPAKLMAEGVKFLVPGLAQLETVKTVATTLYGALKYALMVYTIGNILYNLVLSARKAYTDYQSKKSGAEGGETGGEPEVQTAGYKPNGEFKIKEGKLIFIS